MQVNWGMVGVSNYWANKVFAPAITQHSKLYAVSSRSECKDFMREHNVVKSYNNIKDLIADDNVQIIWIAVPDRLHYKYAKLCLIGGKHVFIEKPITQYYSQAKKLYDLANLLQLQIHVDYHNRYNPFHIEMKNRIDNGLIGDIKLLKFTFYTHYAHVNSEWTKLQDNPGGWALSHIGTHLIDLVQWFLGSNLRILHKKLLNTVYEAEDYCYIILANTKDVMGIIQCSTIEGDANINSKMSFYGTKGDVELINTFNGGGSYIHQLHEYKIETSNPYAEEVATINESVLNNTYKPNYDPLENIKIMEDIRTE